MLKNKGKRMPKDNINLENRYTIFNNVFNTKEGQMVLDYLTKVFSITTPNFDNPNNVYWELGRQSAVNFIKTILYYGGKDDRRN